MKVLGLGTEGESGAAIVEDGRIVAAANEERFSRIKLAIGFPRKSLVEVLRLASTDVRELDAVIVAGVEDVFAGEIKPFEGWFQYSPSGVGGRVKRLASRFSGMRDQLPFLENIYYAGLQPSFWYRRRAIRQVLQNDFAVRCPIHFVDHHFAHVTSAYFTSGFRDALVFSVDGGGDGKSSVVYEVRNGHFVPLHQTSAFNSLGNYYAYVTHMCGFKAMRHEGKITGLAAHGEPRYVPILREFIDEVNGSLVNRGGAIFQEAIRKLERRLPSGWSREDLAASIQSHFEDVVRRYVGHWVRRTGIRDVAVAGGVFANVRVNEEVHSLPEIDRLFVHPGMSDGGLPVGAALAACVPGVLSTTMVHHPEPLQHVYLGPDISDADIARTLRRHQLTPEALGGSLEERIADLLVEGHVVARAAGRMEYGPRALGNRSILYHPTDRDVNDWLNRNLRRTEFMPFAPSMLFEARNQCFEGVEGAEHSAEFMTITFHATPWTAKHLPGVVHIDNTARPQFVRRDRNSSYYDIIDAFYQRTGLPAVINTSFNMHEEPIVCSADDAVRAFLDGNLDYLALGSLLIPHPKGVLHPLKKVRAAKALSV